LVEALLNDFSRLHPILSQIPNGKLVITEEKRKWKWGKIEG
jgi:hypothetical protein